MLRLALICFLVFVNMSQTQISHAAIPFDLRVVVLTWKRRESLIRLLQSLESAYYGNARLLLEIHFDGAPRKDFKAWLAALSAAGNFNFTHGTKAIEVAKRNGGLRNAWLRAWPSAGFPDDIQTVIFEDDIEVSKWWYAWLVVMWKTYGSRTDLGGIALSRQMTHPLIGAEGKEYEIHNGNEPFLYKQVGSWGFSPNALHWRKFLDEERQWRTEDARIGNLGINQWLKTKVGSVWTIFWMKWSVSRGLFTLYVTCPKNQAIAVHHREIGEHFGKSFGAQYKALAEWPPSFNSPPRDLKHYGWDLKEFSA